MSLPRLNPVEPPWYGPVCPVVGEGWHREVPPIPINPVIAQSSKLPAQSERPRETAMGTYTISATCPGLLQAAVAATTLWKALGTRCHAS
jgi:hypothetical protein